MHWNKKSITIIIVAVIVIISGLAIYNHSRPKEVTNYEFEDEQAKTETKKQEKGVTPGIQIPGYKSITISSGTKNAKVELTNPEGNNVYFEISFYLPDTDEVIYKSKLIKPGQTIYDIELDREMEEGEYPMIVRYGTYSADDEMTPRNGAEVNCSLIVK